MHFIMKLNRKFCRIKKFLKIKFIILFFYFRYLLLNSIKIKYDEFYNIAIEIKIISNKKLPYDIIKTHNIDFMKIQDQYSSDEYLLENVMIFSNNPQQSLTTSF